MVWNRVVRRFLVGAGQFTLSYGTPGVAEKMLFYYYLYFILFQTYCIMHEPLRHQLILTYSYEDYSLLIS